MRFFIFVFAVLFFSCQSTDQKSKSVSTDTIEAKDEIESKKSPSTSRPEVKINPDIISAAKVGDQWHFINQNSAKVNNEKYNWVDNYSCGRACVSKNYKVVDGIGYGHHYFFIDKNGKPGKKKFYDDARYHEDRTFLIDRGNKWALFDLDEEILADGFDEVGIFSEGLAYVSKEGQAGYINKNGDWDIIVEKGLVLTSFQDGLAMVKKDGKAGYINKKGDWQIEPVWEVGTFFNDDRAIVKRDGTLSLIDRNGEIVAELDGDYVAGFSEGLCGFRKSKKWGYIDRDANLVTEMIFDNCRLFSEGYAAVMIDNKVGFIDKSGNMVIEPKFDIAYDFKYGFAIASKDSKLGYIDTQGEFVIEPKYDRVHHFVDINQSNLMFNAN